VRRRKKISEGGRKTTKALLQQMKDMHLKPMSAVRNETANVH